MLFRSRNMDSYQNICGPFDIQVPNDYWGSVCQLISQVFHGVMVIIESNSSADTFRRMLTQRFLVPPRLPKYVSSFRFLRVPLDAWAKNRCEHPNLDMVRQRHMRFLQSFVTFNRLRLSVSADKYVSRLQPNGETLIDIYYNNAPSINRLLWRMLVAWFYGRPIVIGQPCPQHASRITDEMKYTFLPDGRFHQTVKGGSTYSQHLYDFRSSEYLTIFGIFTYHVTRRVFKDDEFEMVLLTPWATRFSITSHSKQMPLSHFVPVVGVKDPMVVVDTYGYRSVSLPQSYSCIDVAYAEIDRLRGLDGGKLGITSYDIKKATDLDEPSCGLLQRYMRATGPSCTDVVSESGVIHYVFNPMDLSSVKLSARAMCPPFVENGAYVPLADRGNDARMTVGRVMQMQVHAEEDPPEEYEEYAKEFTTLIAMQLCPDGKKLKPLTVEDAASRQTKPSQWHKWEQTARHGKSKTPVSFRKNECYPEPKDPRMISQEKDDVKLQSARFAYAIMDALKLCDWYAFGRTPSQIADIITRIAEATDELLETDYSRWDGHVTRFLVAVFSRILTNCFDMTEELDYVLNSRNNVWCRTFFWILMCSFWSQRSGDMFTSSSNSILNKFVMFCTSRRSGLSAIDSYNALGIFGGDDGLAHGDPKMLAEVCRDLHLAIKVKVVKRGGRLSFLSRIFGPRVWDGCPNNCCDIPRQLAKLHLTTRMDPTLNLRDLVSEKFFAYWLTDEHTPVIGMIVSAWLDKYPYAEATNDATWWAKFDKTVQWPNWHEGWMIDYLHESIPDLDKLSYEDWSVYYEAWMVAPETPYPPLVRKPIAHSPAVFLKDGEVLTTQHPGSRKCFLTFLQFLKFLPNKGPSKIKEVFYIGAKSEYVDMLIAECPVRLRLFDPRFTEQERKKHVKNKQVKFHTSMFCTKTIERLQKVINNGVAVFDDSLEVSGLSNEGQRLKHLETVRVWHDKMCELGVRYWSWKVPECAFNKHFELPSQRKIFKTPENNPLFSQVSERRVFTSQSEYSPLCFDEYQASLDMDEQLIHKVAGNKYDLKLMMANKREDVENIMQEIREDAKAQETSDSETTGQAEQGSASSEASQVSHPEYGPSPPVLSDEIPPQEPEGEEPPAPGAKKRKRKKKSKAKTVVVEDVSPQTQEDVPRNVYLSPVYTPSTPPYSTSEGKEEEEELNKPLQ